MIAWTMWAFFVLSYGTTLVLERANVTGENDVLGDITLAVAFASFATVGAVIASRRPGNAIGWIFCSIGLLVGAGVLAQTYAENYISPGSPPSVLGGVAAWVTGWYWFPLIALVLVFVPMLFPNGTLPSRRWRPLFWLAVVSIGGVTLLSALQEQIQVKDDLVVTNPIGVTGITNPEQSLAGSALAAIGLICTVAAAVSLVVRFRRSRGEERQQLKWFTYAAGLIPVLTTVDELLPDSFSGPDVMFGVMVAALPVATAIAVFKYRLYDIDRIINRTLVYGALTAVLGLAYYGVVVLLQSLFGSALADSQLVVAATTLGVATLFRPVKVRIQAIIDRRFNRARYDAQRTVEAFSSRLRDQVDLETLSADLLHVVADTLQPSQASLWLRPRREDDPVQAGAG
jgi:hypothetical protein